MLEVILVILLVVLIVVTLVILYYIRHPKRQQKRREFLVPPKIARQSREVLKELRTKFEAYYQKFPKKNELITLIIMTSHIVIPQNSLWAHWMRWRIRLFLAAENHVWYGARPANMKTLTNVFGVVK